MNANLTGFNPQDVIESADILDIWIKTRKAELIAKVTDSLDNFDAAAATEAIAVFIDDLSNWYIRRSRERINPEFLSTLYTVLVDVCRLIAPIMPFVSETIYTNLTKESSVHLSNWPEKTAVPHTELTGQMMYIRQVTELAHSKRKDEKIAVRQPLLSLTVTSPTEKPDGELLAILSDELNVKRVVWQKGETLAVTLDTTITPELEAEAQARELIRTIQGARKEMGTTLDEKINVTLPEWPKAHEDLIKRKTLIQELSVGVFSVQKVS
jgi:isoleucyl-tRNA synthetase